MDQNLGASLAAKGLTYFASPERASEQEIAVAARGVVANSLVARLLDAMPDWVMLLNQHRQIVHGNESLLAFARNLGISSPAGNRPGELMRCREAGRAPGGCGTGEGCRNCGAAEVILKALEGQKTTRECRILSEINQHPVALDLQATGTPLEWLGERYVLLVVSDIGPLKRRQVLERIFFHDVLNTAGSIQGIVELLAGGDVEAGEIVDDLGAATEHLINEIKGQRMLLEAESDSLKLHLFSVRTRAVLEMVARAFRNHAVARGKQIELAPDTLDASFYTDMALLLRVLGNLLKNALEASDPGQKVLMGCRSTEEGVAFWCQNQRVMPAEVQQQMFQRSFSTKGKGRGIGTYSVKLLAERYLKGRVSFISTADAGTVFTVELPTLAVEASKSAAAPSLKETGNVTMK